MRVLHLYSGNLYGGVERVLATIARHRDACPAMSPAFALCFEGRLADELRGAGAGVSILGPTRFSRPWTIWQTRRRLTALLAPESFDVAVCHSYWPHALFAPVIRRAALPLVFAAHDVPDGRHWLQRQAARTLPDAVLANSAYTGRAVAALFPAAPVHVHACPVPPPDADPSARVAIRADWGVTDDTAVILMAARLEPLKGHSVLLRALGRLRDVPGWACKIAGGVQRPKDEAYLQSLRQSAAELGITGRMQFLGQRDDVPRLMAAADLLCQPNVGPEGFGLAFVEALYAGLPVVTTDLGGGAEVIDNSCGALVAAGEVDALAAALDALVRNPARRAALGAAGPARAAQLCDPRRLLPRLEASLRQIVSGVRPEAEPLALQAVT